MVTNLSFFYFKYNPDFENHVANLDQGYGKKHYVNISFLLGRKKGRRVLREIISHTN